MKQIQNSDSQDTAMPGIVASKDRAIRLLAIIASLIGIGVLFLGIGEILDVLSLPVGVIIWSAIFVFVLRGPVAWLENKGINRAIATTLSYILMGGVLTIIGLVLFSPAFGFGMQFQGLVQSIPVYIEQISHWWEDFSQEYAFLMQNDVISSLIKEFANSVSLLASETARVSAGGVVVVGTVLGNIGIVVGFSLVVAFWLLLELPKLGKEAWRFINPKHHEDAEMIHLTFTRVLGGYIKATLLQCMLIGVLCGVAFAIIGVPNYAAIAAITGLLNIIPIVGPWLGGALAGISTVFVDPFAALGAIIVTIIVQQFIYTFISPRLMASSVNVHPVLVILAMLAGSAIGSTMSGLVGGVLGMLISIPAVAAAKSIFVYYYERKTGRTIISEEGVFFQGQPSYTEDGCCSPVDDCVAPSVNPSKANKSRHEALARTKQKSRMKKIQHKSGIDDFDVK